MAAAHLKAISHADKIGTTNACVGKIGLNSRALAAQIAQRDWDKPREAYKCETCGLWHLSTPRKKLRP
jgi:hypothetical protein